MKPGVATKVFREMMHYHRKRRRVSGPRMEKDTDIPIWAIYRIEKGSRDVSFEEAVLIARYIGFSLRDIQIAVMDGIGTWNRS